MSPAQITCQIFLFLLILLAYEAKWGEERVQGCSFAICNAYHTLKPLGGAIQGRIRRGEGGGKGKIGERKGDCVCSLLEIHEIEKVREIYQNKNKKRINQHM